MLHDKALQKTLQSQIDRLRRTLDAVGPTPLRRRLDSCATDMHNALKQFDEAAYEDRSALPDIVGHIAIEWKISDVRSRPHTEQLNDWECFEVLTTLEKSHDATRGISYADVDAAINRYLEGVIT